MPAHLPAIASVQASAHAQSVAVDGVDLTVAAPFLESHRLSASNPGNAHQVAAAFDHNLPGSLVVAALPYGTKAPGEPLPASAPGSASAMESASRSRWILSGATTTPAPIATLFGAPITGTEYMWAVGHGQSGPGGAGTLFEWVTDAGNRVWIVRVEGPDHDTTERSAAHLMVNSANVALPSTLTPVGSSGNDNNAAANPLVPSASAAGPAGNLGIVPWWNGDCDDGHYFATSGVHSYPLQARFLGLEACGPRPISTQAPDVGVTFTGAHWGVLEFECVELSMRYMQLAWGVHPYPANGGDVVSSYYVTKTSFNPAGPSLVVENNGSATELAPGDVLSASDGGPGHTAVVSWTSLDASGSGTVGVIEENASATGAERFSVVDYVIQDSWAHFTGWLHNPLWGTAPSANVLRGASFEPSVGGSWQFDLSHQMAVSTRDSGAVDGQSYLEVNSGMSGGSVYQDVATAVTPNQDDTLSLWVRSPAGQATGVLALWGMGIGPTEGTATPFVTTSAWTLVTATLDPRWSHTTLRAQIFDYSAGVSLDIDGAQLVPQLLRNAGFGNPTSFGWQWDQTSAMNLMVYSGGSKDGAAYLETNTMLSGGSVFQDTGASVTTGQDDTFSIWVRSPSGAPVSGTVALWGLGLNATEGNVTPFVAGPTWSQVSTTLDPQQVHSSLRAQVYLTSTGANLDLSGAQLNPQLLRNAGFNNAPLVWQSDTSAGMAILTAQSPSAKDSSSFLVANTTTAGGSVFQDVSVAVTPKIDNTFSVWVRSGSAQPTAGVLALWGIGGNPTEGTGTTFLSGPTWTRVTVTLDPLEAHTTLRAQIYLYSAHTNLEIDAANLTQAEGG